MASFISAARPSGLARSICKEFMVAAPQTCSRRSLHTAWSLRPEKISLPRDLPKQFESQIPFLLRKQKSMFVFLQQQQLAWKAVCFGGLGRGMDEQKKLTTISHLSTQPA